MSPKYNSFCLVIVVVSGVLGNVCIKIEEPTVLPENDGNQLINHLLDSFATHSLIACGERCLLRRRCKSVNFDVNLHLCELNTASSLTAPTSDVVDVVTSSHYTSDQFPQVLLGKCAYHECNESSTCTPNPPGSKTRYTCVEDLEPSNIEEPICNGKTNIDGGTVTLMSPDIDGDGYYDNFTDCTWTFEVTSGYIKITTQAFELELSDLCLYDWVTIHDGYMVQGPFCGSTIKSEVTSVAMEMVVVFHTDDTVVRTGFTFTVENV